ncbi:hypothetical protein LINPERHAP1_LOCUS36791 [Linum perenne]
MRRYISTLLYVDCPRKVPCSNAEMELDSEFDSMHRSRAMAESKTVET